MNFIDWFLLVGVIILFILIVVSDVQRKKNNHINNNKIEELENKLKGVQYDITKLQWANKVYVPSSVKPGGEYMGVAHTIQMILSHLNIRIQYVPAQDGHFEIKKEINNV